MDDLIEKLKIDKGLSPEETVDQLMDKCEDYKKRIQDCRDEKRRHELSKVLNEIEEAVEILTTGITLAAADDAAALQVQKQDASPEGGKSAPQQYFEGIAYFRDRNYDKAFEYLEPFAKKGDLTAQMICANCQLHLGSNHEAKRWFFAAAKQGDWSAMYMLATLYYQESNMASAEEWVQKAIDRDHAVNPYVSVDPYMLLAKIKKYNGDSLDAYRLLRQAIQYGQPFQKHKAFLEMEKYLTEATGHLAMSSGMPEVKKLLNGLIQETSINKEKEMLSERLEAIYRREKEIEEEEKKKAKEKRKRILISTAVILVMALLFGACGMNIYNYFRYDAKTEQGHYEITIPQDVQGVVSYPAKIIFKQVYFLNALGLRNATGIKLKEGLYSAKIENSPKISEITLPGDISYLDLNSLDGLKSIDLSSRPKDLKRLSIRNCKSMTAFSFGAKSDELDISLPNLEKLTWENGANVGQLSIGASEKLTSLDFPDGVWQVSIYGLNGLKTLVLPKGVNVGHIGDCSKLEAVTLYAEPKNGNFGVDFGMCPSLKIVYVPDKYVAGYKKYFAQFHTELPNIQILPIK